MLKPLTIAMTMVASLVACTNPPNDPLVIATDKGAVKGVQQESLRVFKGIPFASPPVGDKRWRAPTPPTAWQDVLQADSFAPACAQIIHPFMSLANHPVSEDCLYLNVWTPATDDRRQLPVVVWIHGGGFSYGTTAMSLWDGAALAQRDVIVVSLAYRLSSFGFLAHPELSREAGGHSGNYALMDQIAGLKWVQKNIAAFGGDPNKVTIMGESAGGVSVSLLAQAPAAKGLFRGVISQSGAAVVNTGSYLNLADAEQKGVELMQRAGASSLAELRDIPLEKILEATATHSTPGGSTWPIIDGAVISGDPTELYRHGQQSDVALLIGNNELEGALFNRIKSADEYRAWVNQRFPDKADAIFAAYPAGDSDASAVKAAIDLGSDTTFAIQGYSWARLQDRHGQAPVYYYHWDHHPPARPGMWPGAIHGAELPYVFGTMKMRPQAWTDKDYAMSDQIMSYWSNFIKTGNPNGEGMTEWHPFSEAQPVALYFNDGASRMGNFPHAARLATVDPLTP